MSQLERLLATDYSLDKSDCSDLRAWLAALQEDCEIFGATPEDDRRMQAIKTKLATFAEPQ